MAAPLKRKWLQVHLSTAVVLMFATGALLWANTCVPTGIRNEKYDTHCYVQHINFGWPFNAMWLVKTTTEFIQPAEYDGSIVLAKNVRVISAAIEIPQSSKLPSQKLTENSFQWHPIGLVFDATIAFLILLLVAVACEMWIRRNKTRLDTSN